MIFISRALLLVGLLGFTCSPQAHALNADAAEAACREIAAFINGLVDYTNTTCLPGAGNAAGSISLILVSSEPVFSVEAARKGWLLSVVAAVGLHFREHENLIGEEIVVSDAKMMESRRAYRFSIALASKLQRQVSSNQITLEAMWTAVNNGLSLYAIPQ